VLRFSPAAWRRFTSQLKPSLASGLTRTRRPTHLTRSNLQAGSDPQAFIMTACQAAVARVGGATAVTRSG
jgi:hypothetical protein